MVLDEVMRVIMNFLELGGLRQESRRTKIYGMYGARHRAMTRRMVKHHRLDETHDRHDNRLDTRDELQCSEKSYIYQIQNSRCIELTLTRKCQNLAAHI